MIAAWRLARRVHSAFDGRGAERYGGRWNPVGTSAIYASQSRSLAVLELLVHVDPAALPRDLMFSRVSFDERDVEEADPPAGWRDAGSIVAVQYGARWLGERRSLVLRVPSAVVPDEHNFVINPRHARASTLVIAPTLEEFSFDERLFRRAESR